MCTGDQRPARDHDRTGVAARAGSAQRALPVRLQGIFPRGKCISCFGYVIYSKATCRKILPVGIYFFITCCLFVFVCCCRFWRCIRTCWRTGSWVPWWSTSCASTACSPTPSSSRPTRGNNIMHSACMYSMYVLYVSPHMGGFLLCSFFIFAV